MNTDPKGAGPRFMTRVVRGKPADRQFDIDFWQAQGDEAIFDAIWEMIVLRRSQAWPAAGISANCYKSDTRKELSSGLLREAALKVVGR